MSQKDYIKLAAALKNARPWNYTVNTHAPASIAWIASVTNVSATLMQDNPRFNSDRFLTACGVS